MTALALDTSVAVPLLVAHHPEHAAVVRWVGARAVALTGHSLVETYSVLTRLPGGSRVSPSDAVRLVEENFDVPLLLGPTSAAGLPALLAGLGIAGGATYDALVALAAREHGAVLATRDGRARPTYEAVGVTVVVAG